MAYPIPTIPPIPGGLNYLEPYMTPNQIATNIATRGNSLGTGLERSEASQNYLSSLLANQLLGPQGNIVGDYTSLPPVVRSYFTNQLGYSPASTEEFLGAIGVDMTQPVTPDAISNALRNLNVQSPRDEGGERGPGGPQSGVGSVGAIAAPSLGDVQAGLGAATALGPLAPAAAPIAGAGLLGALGLAGLGELGTTGVLGGATRPQIGSTEFGFATGDPNRQVGGAGTVGELGALAGRVAAARESGDRQVGGAGSVHDLGALAGRVDRAMRDRDRGGGGRSGPSGPSGSGGGLGGDPHGGGYAQGGLINEMPYLNDVVDAYKRGFAEGGLIKKGYAEGGEIPMEPTAMMPQLMDPTYMPPPQGENGMDDTTITAQTGEYVVARPAVEMFGAEFFDTLNHLAQQNPNLEPKEVLKAASAMIPKSETQSSKAMPGDIGARIGSAIGQGSFAGGGLIGRNPVRL